MILRKKQVHFLCVLRTQGCHVHTFVTKTKALHYNQHKIVTFDTLSYHIAFKISGDHFNAPQ